MKFVMFSTKQTLKLCPVYMYLHDCTYTKHVSILMWGSEAVLKRCIQNKCMSLSMLQDETDATASM